MLELAIELAVKAHKGQVDRYGKPYILHALRVMLKGQNDDEQTVGILHDVLEKSAVTAKELLNYGFSNRVVEAVEAISKHENESYDEYLQRCIRNPLAARVKLYDLQDNMDIGRMEEFDENSVERLRKFKKAYYEIIKSL